MHYSQSVIFLKHYKTLLITEDFFTLEYGFLKIDNTDCSQKLGNHRTLIEAKKKCQDDQECDGVLDVDCKNNENYYLCKNSATLQSESEDIIKSCFYRKYKIEIGTYIS